MFPQRILRTHPIMCACVCVRVQTHWCEYIAAGISTHVYNCVRENVCRSVCVCVCVHACSCAGTETERESTERESNSQPTGEKKCAKKGVCIVWVCADLRLQDRGGSYRPTAAFSMCVFVYCEWKETERGNNTKVNRRKRMSSREPFEGRRGGDFSARWERGERESVCVAS